MRSTMGWEDEDTPLESYLLQEKVVHTPIGDTQSNGIMEHRCIFISMVSNQFGLLSSLRQTFNDLIQLAFEQTVSLRDNYVAKKGQ